MSGSDLRLASMIYVNLGDATKNLMKMVMNMGVTVNDPDCKYLLETTVKIMKKAVACYEQNHNLIEKRLQSVLKQFEDDPQKQQWDDQEGCESKSNEGSEHQETQTEPTDK